MKSFDPGLVKNAITESGLSIETIAQRSQVTTDCLYKILRGDRKNPSVSTISSIAHILGKTSDDFIVDTVDDFSNEVSE
jgi:predicted transcriptional regulator